MEPYYHTLHIIYQIANYDACPSTYLCSPHQILLRHTESWSTIEKHLELLNIEKLIVIKKLDMVAISITPKGIEKAKTLKNEYLNDN